MTRKKSNKNNQNIERMPRPPHSPVLVTRKTYRGMKFSGTLRGNGHPLLMLENLPALTVPCSPDIIPSPRQPRGQEHSQGEAPIPPGDVDRSRDGTTRSTLISGTAMQFLTRSYRSSRGRVGFRQREQKMPTRENSLHARPRGIFISNHRGTAIEHTSGLLRRKKPCRYSNRRAR